MGHLLGRVARETTLESDLKRAQPVRTGFGATVQTAAELSGLRPDRNRTYVRSLPGEANRRRIALTPGLKMKAAGNANPLGHRVPPDGLAPHPSLNT
jgi:hypothetical protein